MSQGAAMPHVPFVFSVDVEDPQSAGDGQGAPDRVAAMTQRYLAYLAQHRARGTFFIVGEVAQALPDLVRRIAASGNEVACHSHRHIALHRLGESGLRDDTARALDALARAGAGPVSGYRAPMFSLTRRTPWAHRVLAGLGFSYSSSVLAAPNPLFGWAGFGDAPRMVEGVLELPVTLLQRQVLPVPAGGVYFRALPKAIVRGALKRHFRHAEPVRSYLHPYDIDDAADAPPHPAYAARGPYNWLLRRNRHDVLARLDEVLGQGFRLCSYQEHALAIRAQLAKGDPHDR